MVNFEEILPVLLVLICSCMSHAHSKLENKLQLLSRPVKTVELHNSYFRPARLVLFIPGHL